MWVHFLVMTYYILKSIYNLIWTTWCVKAFRFNSNYKIEMGTKLNNKRGKNLYEFWDEKIMTLNNRLTKNNAAYLLNLSSNEYFL